jgi:hypothetical protein
VAGTYTVTHVRNSEIKQLSPLIFAKEPVIWFWFSIWLLKFKQNGGVTHYFESEPTKDHLPQIFEQKTLMWFFSHYMSNLYKLVEKLSFDKIQTKIFVFHDPCLIFLISLQFFWLTLPKAIWAFAMSWHLSSLILEQKTLMWFFSHYMSNLYKLVEKPEICAKLLIDM